MERNIPLENGSAIAIDGPVASGKTTVGRSLAHRLKYRFLDTGGMYRAVTLAALNEHLDLNNPDALTRLTENMRIDVVTKPDGARLLVNDLDVTDRLRERAVDQNVSQVSAVRGVRVALVDQQRKIGQQGSIVMVGRDIGTVVLPDAGAKVFLDASVEVRANRRFLQTQKDNGTLTYQNILDDLVKRDQIDSERAESPLVPAEDALILDTKNLTIEQVVELILNELRNR
ncbi:MAG: (d)CMP kinase [Chloroflexi bacterium]|nr:(d)CMP kinase [Chloroflexota bacterium]